MVRFFPSNSQDRAFVLVIQTWHDDRVSPADLRRECRTFSESVFRHFKALCASESIERRWPRCSVDTALVIKHVRYLDLNEVLGVTVGPTMEFEKEAATRVEAEVKERGGIWK